ncbi:MAG TPA: restriction endonuclease subunit S [Candidatus Acidoferrales bacterium]|nr:restriction endonuclease subunit S [Candidatus Acidoferrales bacterium]
MRKTEEENDEVTVELQPLPDGWVWSNLGEIGLARLGKTPGKTDYRDSGEYKIVKFRDVDEHGQVDWDNVKKGYVDSAPKVLRTLKELKDGDVLVTASAHMSEHIGKKVGIVRNIPSKYKAAYVVGEILQIRTKEEFDPRWVLYFLRSAQGYKAVQRRVHGVHLIASRAQNIEIPVAPFAQQKHIVAEIEKQFSRLDEAVANLKRVKANLKRYKAAVLKAAVEGRLVETEASIAHKKTPSPLAGEGRGEGVGYETGKQLLQRILETRRSKWKGKGKYKEPAAPDTTHLPELPEGWTVATLDAIAKTASGGTPRRDRSSNYGGGIPWVKSGELGDSVVTVTEETISIEGLESSSAKVFPKGTLCIALYGATVGKLGVLGIDAATNQAVCGVFPIEGIDKSYLKLYLEAIRGKLIRLGQGGAQPNISQEILRNLVVPIPSVAEQVRIVSEVDRCLSLIRETEAQVDVSIKRAERLHQSVLHTAFSSEFITRR